MKLIDVHAHLELCKNPEEAVKNFQEGIILSAGVNIESNRKVVEFSNKFQNVKACLGIYPSEALKLSDEEIDSEIEFIKKQDIIAISEVGLDLKETGEDTLKKQIEVLKKFVNLAKELNVPVIIHSRKAELQTIELLEEIGYGKIIMHCFHGKFKLVRRIIENGWNFSIPTSVKNSDQLQRMVEETPIEQLFCETDSPYLHPDRMPNNEPANVIESYKKIAELKGLSLEEVKKKIWENYEKLFSRN